MAKAPVKVLLLSHGKMFTSFTIVLTEVSIARTTHAALSWITTQTV